MMVLLKTKKAQATSLSVTGKSGRTAPVPQGSRSGRSRGPWKNKTGNGHQKQNGNGHQNHNGNGWGHGGQ